MSEQHSHTDGQYRWTCDLEGCEGDRADDLSAEFFGEHYVSTAYTALAKLLRLYATEESNKALEEAEAKVNRIGNDSQALDDAIDCIRSLKKPLPPS